MIFRRISKVSGIFKSWNNNCKIALQMSIGAQEYEKIDKKQFQKPYQKLLYSPFVQSVRIQEHEQQILVRPKLTLDVARKQANQLSFLKKLYLSEFLERENLYYITLAISMVEDLIKNIDNDLTIDFQLRQLSPVQLDKIIILFNNIQNSVKQDIVELLSIHFIKIANAWLKEESRLHQDQKTWQDSEVKLKYEDIEKVLDYLITRGFVPMHLIDRYIEQLKNIPKIAKSDSPQKKFQIFKKIKHRIRAMYNLQQKYFKIKPQVKDNSGNHQSQPLKETQANQFLNICSQAFQTKIGKHIYDQHINAYLQAMLNNEQIFYLGSVKQQLGFFRIFQVRFLYKQQTIPKVKQAYQNIFIKIFDFQSGFPLFFTTKNIYVYVFETINDMFSPINEKDKQLVHYLLKQFERFIILNPQTKLYYTMPFYLSKMYYYQSQFLLYQLKKLIVSEYKQLIKQSHNISKFFIVNYRLSNIKSTELYIYQYFLMLKKNSQFKEYQTENEKEQAALENKLIIQSFSQNVITLLDFISSQKGQQFFNKYMLTKFDGTNTRGLDYQSRSLLIEKNNSLKKINQLLSRMQINIYKKLIELNATEFGRFYEGRNILDTFNQERLLFYPFKKSWSVLKLIYFIDVFTQHLHLISSISTKDNSFRWVIKNNEQIVKVIKQYICFPYLLKNLVELFSILDNQQENANLSQFVEKQIDLFRFIDHARNMFSSQFKILNMQDPKSLDKFNKYPNIYSFIAQFQSNEYTISNIDKHGYSLSTQNINSNFINDIYGQILIHQSQLKIKVQQQLAVLKENSTTVLKIQKNYMQYPYFTDFFLMKDGKLYAIMIVQGQKNIYIEDLYQKSIKYFKSQKFIVLQIDKIQKIAQHFAK